MIPLILVLGVGGWLMGSGVRGWGSPVDLRAPETDFGMATAEGYVQFWREVMELPVADNFTLPLRYGFSSQPDLRSPELGLGWSLPLLESSAVLVSERMMQVRLLCGKTLWLLRRSKTESAFTSRDNVWQGLLNGDRFLVFRPGRAGDETETALTGWQTDPQPVERYRCASIPETDPPSYTGLLDTVIAELKKEESGKEAAK